MQDSTVVQDELIVGSHTSTFVNTMVGHTIRRCAHCVTQPYQAWQRGEIVQFAATEDEIRTWIKRRYH